MDINWNTGEITIYKTDPFMSFTGGDVYDLDTDGFHKSLRDEEDSEYGIVFPKTHRHNTSVLLGGIEYARIIEILSPYNITFDDAGGSWVCNLNGSNNNILDVTNLTSVQVRSNNSAGLINVRELQHGIFGGEVHYDSVAGVAGTLYPIGTPLLPGNNFPDLTDIAYRRGFDQIHITGNAVLGAGDNVSNFTLIGQNPARTSITINPDAETLNCEILESFVEGTLDGGAILRNDVLEDLDYVNGYIMQSMLNPGTITLGGGAIAYILDSFSGVPGQGTPVIDFGGSGQALAMRNYSGGVKLINKTGPESVSIDLDPGQCIIDTSTVTNGAITVRGTGKLTDQNGDRLYSGVYGSLTIIADDLVNPKNIAKSGKLLTIAKFLGLK